jgi:uncharacterized protein (TIGR03437 family)
LQVNFFIPAVIAPGRVGVRVVSGDGTITIGEIQVTRVAPGLFAANADGNGVASAVVVRVKSDNSQTVEDVFRFDPVQSRFVPNPISFGPGSDRLILVLFGTGLRFALPGGVSLTLGSTSVPVDFAGANPVFIGLDQVNAEIPRTLMGSGEITISLTVEGQAANTLTMAIQ